MLKRLHTYGGRRRGTTIVCVALLSTVIIGALAFVLDGGLLQDNKRKVQGAADAAALAAASKLFVKYPAIITSNYLTFDPNGDGAAAAQSSATVNGFTNDNVHSSVTVNIPPTAGPFTGQIGYAEVIITYNQPRYFSTIWGSGTTPVKARAVARGRWAGSGDGIILLDPSVKSALNATGGGNLTVTGNAAVIVDSSDSSAATVSGGGQIVANTFDITGNYTGALTGSIYTGTIPVPDPLAYLPAPSGLTAGTMRKTGLGNGNFQYTLSPGTYSNLPNFASGDVVILQQASTNSNGGIFYITDGGLTSTGANITMDATTSGGVMIYNGSSRTSQNQSIGITGNSSGTVNLSALTTGAYAGILFWQARSLDVSMSVAGNGNFSLLGTFYTPAAELKITGNGAAVIGSQYISRTLTTSGGSNITINYSDTGTARIREVILVE